MKGENETKLTGVTTDFLYYWDDEYGWVHISEKEKLREAHKRFVESAPSRVGE